jgi:hypothetical protein
MVEKDTDMAKWQGLYENRAVLEGNTTFWG